MDNVRYALKYIHWSLTRLFAHLGCCTVHTKSEKSTQLADIYARLLSIEVPRDIGDVQIILRYKEKPRLYAEFSQFINNDGSNDILLMPPMRTSGRDDCDSECHGSTCNSISTVYENDFDDDHTTEEEEQVDIYANVPTREGNNHLSEVLYSNI